jgi:hypothetical protein
MPNEAFFAMSGLLGLFVAMATGAVWDSPVMMAPVRVWENFRSQGRHAMPR